MSDKKKNSAKTSDLTPRKDAKGGGHHHNRGQHVGPRGHDLSDLTGGQGGRTFIP